MLLVAALLAASGCFSHASAQAKRAVAGATGAVPERAAIDLRQGMSLEEVQQLLGKPWRTALSSGGSSGTLRWIYDFAAKAPEQWSVSGWSWSTY
jgi:outer membrane protein assembly factor BamE (lipoprotein component of BamABCDE complex)